MCYQLHVRVSVFTEVKLDGEASHTDLQHSAFRIESSDWDGVIHMIEFGIKCACDQALLCPFCIFVKQKNVLRY